MDAFRATYPEIDIDYEELDRTSDEQNLEDHEEDHDWEE